MKKNIVYCRQKSGSSISSYHSVIQYGHWLTFLTTSGSTGMLFRQLWYRTQDAAWCTDPIVLSCFGSTLPTNTIDHWLLNSVPWLITMCRNYLFIVELEKSVHKNWMGRLPYFHVRMNYFWWAKTERLVVYSAVNLLFRNNKI